MTQEALILSHLKRKGTITPLEALNLYGCFRLGAVIFKLKAKGYEIKTEINKDGKPYGIYTLITPVIQYQGNQQCLI